MLNSLVRSHGTSISYNKLSKENESTMYVYFSLPLILNDSFRLSRSDSFILMHSSQSLLIDLLVGRSPSSLTLLRAAYSHRSSLRSLSSISSSSASSSTPTKSSMLSTTTSSKSLDVAVLSAFSSGQIRLRKAWETTLQGRWDDDLDEEDEPDLQRRKDQRNKLLREDLDQLKVALRRGGNVEIVSKILLARSPSYLEDLDGEYRKSTQGHSSLSKAIKQSVASGVLQKMLLFVVKGGKRGGRRQGGESYEFGVWRDTKSLERAVVRVVAADEGKGKDKDKVKEEAKDEVAWRYVLNSLRFSHASSFTSSLTRFR